MSEDHHKAPLYSSHMSEEPEVLSGDIIQRKKEFISNLQSMQKEAAPHSREELFDLLSMLVDMQLNE